MRTNNSSVTLTEPHSKSKLWYFKTQNNTFSKHDKATLGNTDTWVACCVARFEQMLMDKQESRNGKGRQIATTGLKSNIHLHVTWKGMWAKCASWTTYTDIIRDYYHIQIWNTVLCTFKRKGTKGKKKGNFPWPSAVCSVLSFSMFNPKHFPWGWFYNPYFIDEKMRLTSHSW